MRMIGFFSNVVKPVSNAAKLDMALFGAILSTGEVMAFLLLAIVGWSLRQQVLRYSERESFVAPVARDLESGYSQQTL